MLEYSANAAVRTVRAVIQLRPAMDERQFDIEAQSLIWWAYSSCIFLTAAFLKRGIRDVYL